MSDTNKKLARIRKEYGDEVSDVFYYESEEEGAPAISIKGEAPEGLPEERIYILLGEEDYENLADL